jgi:membrane-associated phospholipid phosphatase
MKRSFLVIGVLLSFLMLQVQASAQIEAPSKEPGTDPIAAKEPQQRSDDKPKTDSGSGFGRLLKDIGSDYKNTFSKETAIWYGGGLAAAGLVHLADEDIREALADPPEATTTALSGGDRYGNLTVQLPLAVGWWAISHALGSDRHADAGRDLLRAQINAMSWTYAIKFAVNRERPNGDDRSFPSGHSSATFATAMVLQQHYGWKVGVPFFIGATYTSISRISDDKHWASDVVFGAAVGMASARTVTLHLRKHKIALIPGAVPGGAGVTLIPLD